MGSIPSRERTTPWPGGKWLTFHSSLGLGPAAASSPIDSSQLGPKLKGVRIVDLGTPPLKLQ